jgi:hypothetical protein
MPNHVWAMDISYIPMRRGFVHLAAVIDVLLHLLDHQKSLLTAFLDHLLDRFVLHSIGQAVEV